MVYAVTDDYWGSSELFVSPDSGATWNQTSSFTTASNALKLAVTPARSEFPGCFATNNMSLYVSTTSEPIFLLDKQTCPDLQRFFVSPQSANIMYCGAIVVQKSNDGGMTWQQITDWYNSGSYPEVHAVCTTSTGILYVHWIFILIMMADCIAMNRTLLHGLNYPIIW